MNIFTILLHSFGSLWFLEEQDYVFYRFLLILFLSFINGHPKLITIVSTVSTC